MHENFDNTFKTIVRINVVVFVTALVLALCFLTAGAYIAWHFLSKVW